MILLGLLEIWICAPMLIPSATIEHNEDDGYEQKRAWEIDDLLDIKSLDKLQDNVNPNNERGDKLTAASDETGDCDNIHIIFRADWGAIPPKSFSELQDMPSNVFIHHTHQAFCDSESACKALVRYIQNFHMDPKPYGRGWDDIGYSFLVGEDGNIYEGRGWNREGAHTKGYNNVGLGFAFMGTFSSRKPNQAALDAVKNAMQCGINNGLISSTYKLRGHRDMGNTTCPGDKLYEEIQTWPHYHSDCISSAKQLACDVQENSKIYLIGNNGLLNSKGDNDGADPKSNIRDTCNGGAATRSSYTCSSGSSPGGEVCLYFKLLNYLLSLANDGYSIQVNALAGACHSTTSKHYSGTAVDLQIKNTTTSAQYKAWMTKCQSFEFGGTAYGPGDNGHDTHVHCQINP